ncbi:hypothetical protein CHS0354_036870 [Potamilus streckersoni]|uniref:Metalloendopeptidase OMA1, mitochondrial n=1 Tax=Potamilus streckersoni TaxID=2493646 RepID=A0AAE0S0N1_9BIVA|nr:hypothetical protein CHS0354_036870 [Potamilus streckersoni]
MFVTAQKIHPVFSYLNLFRPGCFSVYQNLHQRYAYIQVCRETRCFQSDLNRHRNMNLFHLKNHKPYIYSIMSMQRIHTSNQCRALPYLECIVLIQVAKLTVIILGRKFNKWLKLQTDTVRSYYRRRLGFLCLISIPLAVLAFVAIYQSNLEDTPVTGRKRYITSNNEAMAGQLETQLEKLDHSNKTLPPEIRAKYRRIVAIIKKLVESNQDFFPDMKPENFTVKIMSGNPLFAGISHSGKILITKEFLKICSENDETAAVLSHELAHYGLSHPAEKFSSFKLVNFFYIIGVMVPIWFFIPRLVYALLAQFVCMVLKLLFVYKPCSRQQEREADLVGLQMMSKACYDARAAAVLFTKFSEYKEKEKNCRFPKPVPGMEYVMEIMECFATHPSISLRLEYLDKLIPAAMKLRRECNCPRLKCNPWQEFYSRKQHRDEQLTTLVKCRIKSKKSTKF